MDLMFNQLTFSSTLKAVGKKPQKKRLTKFQLSSSCFDLPIDLKRRLESRLFPVCAK